MLNVKDVLFIQLHCERHCVEAKRGKLEKGGHVAHEYRCIRQGFFNHQIDNKNFFPITQPSLNTYKTWGVFLKD